MKHLLIGAAIAGLAIAPLYAQGKGHGQGNGGGHGNAEHGPSMKGPSMKGPSMNGPSMHGPSMQAAPHGWFARLLWTALQDTPAAGTTP